MTTIPRNTAAQAALAREFEAARNAYGRAQAIGTGGAVRRAGEVEVWSGPFLHPYHGWMSVALPGAEFAAALETALRIYQPFGTAMFVPIGPDARDEAAMRAALRARKFRCSYHVPVMHLALRDWNPEARAGSERDARSSRWLERDVRVELVRNWDELRDREPEAGGAGATPLARVRWDFRRALATESTPRLWKWIACEHGRAIGHAMYFRPGATALVLDVGVVPERRGRGLGRALMLAVCRHARELGLRAAVLSASRSGVGLYQQLGFTDAGRWSDFLLSGEAIAKLRWA